MHTNFTVQSMTDKQKLYFFAPRQRGDRESPHHFCTSQTSSDITYSFTARSAENFGGNASHEE